jgi:hypothetical protein
LSSKTAAVATADKNSMKDLLTGVLDITPQVDKEKLAEQRATVSASATGGASSSGATSTDAPSGLDTLEELCVIQEDLKKLCTEKGLFQGLEPGEVPNVEGNTLYSQYISANKAYLNSLRLSNVPAFTRTTVLDRPNSDFSFALDLFKKTLHSYKTKTTSTNSGATKSIFSSKRVDSTGTAAPGGSETKRRRTSSSGSSNALASAVASAADSKRRRGPPIIIVPNSLTTPISSVNVKDFLEANTYVPVEEKKKAGGKRQPTQTISLKMASGELQEFLVVDSGKEIKEQDWDRVVAIFVSGQAWQFKGLKWPIPVELFHHVLGVHVAMDNIPVGKEVSGWNCKVLKINPFKRHLDGSAVTLFQQFLNSFLKVHKPWMVK